jgi:hypothetical protein
MRPMGGAGVPAGGGGDPPSWSAPVPAGGGAGGDRGAGGGRRGWCGSGSWPGRLGAGPAPATATGDRPRSRGHRQGARDLRRRHRRRVAVLSTRTGRIVRTLWGPDPAAPQVYAVSSSPDRRTVFFSTAGPSDPCDRSGIFRVPFDGGPATTLVPGEYAEGLITTSADGSRLAYLGGACPFTGRFQVVLRDAGGALLRPRAPTSTAAAATCSTPWAATTPWTRRSRGRRPAPGGTAAAGGSASTTTCGSAAATPASSSPRPSRPGRAGAG